MHIHHHTKPGAQSIRKAFVKELWFGLRIVWPILSGILICMTVLGVIVGIREGWTLGDSLYFAFVSGLTIGYGDFAPTHAGTKLLAIAIGLNGILLTALLGAVAVQALARCMPAHHKN